MNTFFKWFSIMTIIMAVPFTALLVYEQHWLSALTWVFLGISGWFNYKSVLSLIDYEKTVNARIEEMINDNRR